MSISFSQQPFKLTAFSLPALADGGSIHTIQSYSGGIQGWTLLHPEWPDQWGVLGGGQTDQDHAEMEGELLA